MSKTEGIKRLSMVELLSRHYGMEFRKEGGHYVSLSPFTAEKKPSFIVRQHKDGHWLFKDFSSGKGGSIIDFVLLKEGISDVSKAIQHIENLSEAMEMKPSAPSAETAPSYELKDIYRKVRTNQTQVCRQYLIQRGIGNEFIDDLIENGILLHNLYKGHSYCCFAVFDQEGVLRCLDNHQIGGETKFVLGKKVPFTRDWALLAQAERLFICEGVIDYLSMKTLHEGTIPGIALLGNRISVDPDMFRQARVIIAALDRDRGGLSALLDMQERFPDKDYMVCDLGDCKDPNEYLQAVQAGQEPTKLTARDKLNLYREYLQAENKTALADKWGINRSYLYQIVRESEELILSGFSQRHAGRKPEGAPATLTEACERIAILEEEKHHQAREKERYHARSEFLKIRLKWAEKEQQETDGNPPKRQIKKKKRKRS